MHDISHAARSNSSGQTSRQIRSSPAIIDPYQNIIERANSAPIIVIFQHYGISINEYDRKIICPFKSHKNGQESSASFYYYPNTNSYWCFGCRVGSRPVDFVAEIEQISKLKAANKIIDIFNNDIDEETIIERQNFSERLEIMLDFSNTVRKFRNNFEEKHNIFIENICEAYDTINERYDLDNEALRVMSDNLKEKIQNNK